MKTLFLFLILIVCNKNIIAQTNYYKVDKTFYENGYTYQCDVNEKSQTVLLYNAENKFTYVDQIVKSTGKPIPIDDNKASFENDNWTKDRCRTIVKNAFSTEENKRLQGNEFIVGLCISPETGKIIEVDFNFVTFNSFATIPLSVYRQIEVQLKENVWFMPTEYGKNLNFIYLFMPYVF